MTEPAMGPDDLALPSQSPVERTVQEGLGFSYTPTPGITFRIDYLKPSLENPTGEITVRSTCRGSPGSSTRRATSCLPRRLRIGWPCSKSCVIPRRGCPIIGRVELHRAFNTLAANH